MHKHHRNLILLLFRPDHKVDSVTMGVSFSWTITRVLGSSGSQSCTFVNNTWSFSDTFNTTDNSTNSTTSGTTSISVTSDSSASMLSAFDSANGWSDLTKIQCTISNSGVDAGTCVDHDICTTASVEDCVDHLQNNDTEQLNACCICGGGGPPIPIILDINPPIPGFSLPIVLTAACVNCCINSGFCLIISSIPGIADLNIVFVI